jgi:hypothetical protein
MFFADATDGVKPLGASATEAQKQVIRDAAQDSCDGKETMIRKNV